MMSLFLSIFQVLCHFVAKKKFVNTIQLENETISSVILPIVSFESYFSQFSFVLKHRSVCVSIVRKILLRST